MENSMRAIKKINAFHNHLTSRRLAAGSYLAILVMSLGPAGLPAQAGDIPVKIIFHGACPDRIAAGETDPIVDRKKHDLIVWSAVLADGTTPMTEGFSIHFDPFAGQPLVDTNSDGTVKSKKVKETAPPGIYKYTVLGKNCPQAPLDPNIRVR
jgi:hypothetical protein